MLKHLQSSEGWTDKNLAQKGFTLVELLVVIVILGILAAVVVFAVNGIQDRGQNAACSTDASNVRTAVESYRAQAGNQAADPTMVQLVPNFLSKASTMVVINYSNQGSAPHTYTLDGANGSSCGNNL